MVGRLAWVITICLGLKRFPGVAEFGPVYAAGLRRRRPRPGDKWHLDEVFVTINGRRHYLWRAVDQDGTSSTSSSNLAGMPRPPSGSSVTC